MGVNMQVYYYIGGAVAVVALVFCCCFWYGFIKAKCVEDESTGTAVAFGFVKGCKESYKVGKKICKKGEEEQEGGESGAGGGGAAVA